MSHHHLHGAITLLSERLIEVASCADNAETALNTNSKALEKERLAGDALSHRAKALEIELKERDATIAALRNPPPVKPEPKKRKR